jgi:ABC-type nitrate/sulfonate/bicarbonate transport system permease component
LAWELLCRTSRVSPVLLPPPSAVWSVLSGNSEILLQQSVPTTLEPIASFAAATLLGVALGLVSAKPEVLQLCRSLTATEWQIFRLARFPYAMPFVFAGMKVGVTMAMIGVIVGEFITAQAGLGYIIMFASSAGETATVLAAIVLLCAIGLVLFGLVALGEMAVRRWYGDEMPVGGVI